MFGRMAAIHARRVLPVPTFCLSAPSGHSARDPARIILYPKDKRRFARGLQWQPNKENTWTGRGLAHVVSRRATRAEYRQVDPAEIAGEPGAPNERTQSCFSGVQFQNWRGRQDRCRRLSQVRFMGSNLDAALADICFDSGPRRPRTFFACCDILGQIVREGQTAVSCACQMPQKDRTPI